MAEPESSQIDTDLRQATFLFIERNMHGLEPTQFSLFRMVQLVSQLGCGLVAAAVCAGAIRDGLVDWDAWRNVLATLGGIAGGVAGFVVAFMPFDFLDRLFTRHLFRKVKRSSNEDLWKIVDLGFWNFHYTLALLQLGARGQDVRRELPNVIKRLVTGNPLLRAYAWDALRLVFFDAAQAISDYNPKSSAADCYDKVASLFQGISPDETQALLSSGQASKRLSTWELILCTDRAQFSCDKLIAYFFQRVHDPNASPSGASHPATAQETPKASS